MERLSLALLLVFTVMSSSLAQKAVDDFRGLKWGVNLDDAQFKNEENPKFIYRGGQEEKYYVRANEDLSIGTALLENIFYVFDEQSQLYKVILNGKAHANEDMNFIINQRFGKADKRFRKNGNYIRIWRVGDVNVILREQRSKDFVLQLESQENVKNYVSINSSIDDF